MTVFSWSYGFDLITKSFNLVMRHKKLFVYMFIANLIAAGILFFLITNHMVQPGEFILYIVFETLSAFFMVPLIYNVVALVKGDKEPTSYAFNAITHHIVTIIGYVFLVFLSRVFIVAGFTRMPFAVGGIVSNMVLFLATLLYYYVLVIAVVEKVGFIAALKKSFTAVKYTLYAILGGAVWWNIFIVILYLIFVFLPFLLLSFIFPLEKITFNASAAQFVQLLIFLCIFVSFYTLYYTVYVTFQTLLYLKYKEAYSNNDDVFINVEQER